MAVHYRQADRRAAIEYLQLLAAALAVHTARNQLKTAEREARYAAESLRPSAFLDVDIAEHVDSEGATYYVASHGELYANPGDTPDEACENFDNLWTFGREEDDVEEAAVVS